MPAVVLLLIDEAQELGVAIGLKRTEDGGHMELHALRYAAMVSALTFDEAVATFERYLAGTEQELDAPTRILEFSDWEEPDTEAFPTDVRLILASAEFSKEITTTVRRDLSARDRHRKIAKIRTAGGVASL